MDGDLQKLTYGATTRIISAVLSNPTRGSDTTEEYF